jgi:Na+-driven multidrug efflux pump
MTDLFKKQPREVLVKLFLPMAIGFLMLVLMDFADVVVAQRISPIALSILSYCFPIIYLVLAVGIGVNQGLTVTGADSFTNKNFKELNTYLYTSLLLAMCFLCIILASVAVGIGYFGVDQEFAAYYNEIKAFLTVMLSSAIPLFVLLVLCAWLQIQGRVEVIRDTLILMLVSLVFLHPLFALPIGLDWGLVGIAVSKVVVIVIGVFNIIVRLKTLPIEHHPIQKRHILQLSKNTGAAIGIQILVPFYLYILNQFVTPYGIFAVAGFITGYRIAMLMVVPILAVLIALMVAISHYESSSEYEKINQTLRYVLSVGSVIIMVALVITLFLGQLWMHVSMVQPEIQQIAIQYLILAILLTVFEFITGVSVVYFQAVQKPMHAIFMALTKSILFPLPALYLMSLYYDHLTGIWIALLCAFALSSFTGLFMLTREGVLNKVES